MKIRELLDMIQRDGWHLVTTKGSHREFGASVPDLPGCTVGETREEAIALVREAIELHVKGLREDGLPAPVPHFSAEAVEVAVS